MLLACSISFGLKGQHYSVQSFNRQKNTADSLFRVETGYPATGILLKVDESEKITGSFLISAKDTLRFTEGEEGPAGDQKKFSNLQTFGSPINSFLFHPGSIKGEIQFYYINAGQHKEGSTSKPSKKKRCRLFRARHDGSAGMEGRASGTFL